MPTQVKVLAIMPDYLNSIPETYKVEGQVQSTSETAPSTHTHMHISAHPHPHVNKIKLIKI